MTKYGHFQPTESCYLAFCNQHDHLSKPAAAAAGFDGLIRRRNLCAQLWDILKKESILLYFKKPLKKQRSRGPDDTRFYSFKKGVLGFQRLAIMGLSQEGMQPFLFKNSAIVCNGEIYGFRKLKK